jgi:hypothetical protein
MDWTMFSPFPWTCILGAIGTSRALMLILFADQFAAQEDTHPSMLDTFFGAFLNLQRLPVMSKTNVDARSSPETIESLFVAFRLTGDRRYRDQGWRIFQAIEKYCRIPTGGFASVINVDEVPVRYEDKMETFFMVGDLVFFWILSYQWLCPRRVRHSSTYIYCSRTPA